VLWKGTGRPPDYCKPAHRQAAYWKRKSRSVHFRSDTCEHSTEPEDFDPLHAEFDFTLDVCATTANAKCTRFFTRAEDGLAQRWTGRVWMNPPYGRTIGQWLRKAFQSVQSGEAELVVCFLPSRTDTAWWHDYCARGEVRFLRGRRTFSGAKNSAPFPSCVVVFRQEQKPDETIPLKAG
jgi:phage N-6-adenine-methyltransferase